MWSKFIAIVEIWIGLSFVINLISFIPVVGTAIGNVLSAIVGFVAMIPFYSIIIILLGTALFADGILRIKT